MLFETKRLILRRFTIEDVDEVYNFLSNPEVSKYTGEPPISTVQEAEHIINTVYLPEYEKYGYARMAVVHKKDKRVIGFAGLKYEAEWEATDIGYRFLPEYWGKGIATEASLPFIFYGLQVLKLPKIVGATVAANVASSRVLKKLGLKYVDSRDLLHDGTECHWFELQRQDYMLAE